MDDQYTSKIIYIAKIQKYPDGRMDTENAAKYLGFSQKTLAMFRSLGGGPLFIKRGRVFYYKDDLDTWLNQDGKASTTAQMRANISIGKSTC